MKDERQILLDTTGESTYRAVRADIIAGRQPPRARLRLDGLRQRYGASVATLRECLNRLAGEGLVLAEGHRGFAVAPVTQDEFCELAILRDVLEGHALRKSFARGDLDWEGRVVGAHHKLEAIEREMLAGNRSRSELWKRYDKEFHHTLISACDSPELLAAHCGVFDRYLRYQIVAVIFRGEAAATEHRALLQAALNRDADAGAAILTRHITACVEHTMAAGTLDPGPAVMGVAQQDDTVGSTVFRQIRDDILSGRLAPGLKLRLESLRTTCGASVSTLREVLNRLATERLVTAEGQRGFEVAPVSAVNLQDLAHLRHLLESRAMEDSFRNGDVEWESQILAAWHKLAAIEARIETGDRSQIDTWKRYDLEFHQALISACGSLSLRWLHDSVLNRYLRYQMVALSFRNAVSASEHRALLDAALARDATAASEILSAHLSGGVQHALDSGTLDAAAGRSGHFVPGR
ncbi:MAG: FCD domain-containing protein [Pseudotabrizicola sp.]|uniref:GntR family transcriptional regulator n=1 Tax=Pseudotabrizicola sp. TaxID=2939647 RepID=UPI00271853FA|nr:FCD domain-containing protein [Pseudotabrizicola sp.]MDO9638335.1 FCD domain-containing protein [Pseudotabrizicola sp.]